MALAQRLGARAEARTQAQLATPPVERQPKRAPTKLAVLMLDGWLVRQRGPGWGKKKTPETRVEWHEWKTGVYYRHEQAARTAGGRGVLAEKIVIGWQGEPWEFGRRLHWEALRGGLGRAHAKLVVADGAPWIWKVAQDRWAETAELAGQHLDTFAAGKWGQKYPTIVASWRRAWAQVIPFFAYPLEVRRVIYTTNALESLNMQLRKIIKNRGHFPNDEAAAKLIYLALRNITAKWKMPPVFWKSALNQFAIRYADRFAVLSV